MTNNIERNSDAPNLFLLDENLKAVLDSLPYYAVIVDEEFKIRFANRALADSEIFKNKDLINTFCFKSIHGSDFPMKACPLYESLQTGKAVEREIFFEKGSQWVCSSIYPTGMQTQSGKKIFLHTARDITKNRLDQERIEHAILKLGRLTESGIVAITRIVEKRDGYTSGHQLKVGRISKLIAAELVMDENESKGIRIAGMLHDVGMVGVPIKIISKPGRLTDTELAIMQMHSKTGYDIFKDLEFDWPIADISASAS